MEDQVEKDVICEESAPMQESTAAEDASPFFIDESESRKKWWRSFIRATATAVIATVMLIMAFLPVTSIKLGDDVFEDMEFSISAIDTIVFTADSFCSVNLEDLADSELMEKLESIEEGLLDNDELIAESYDELSSGTRRALNKMMNILVRMHMQYEGTMASTALVIASVVAIAYIISAVALLAGALIHISALFRLSKARVKVVEQVCRSLLLLTPLLAISLFAANLLSFPRFAMLGEAFNLSSFAGMAPTGACITTMVVGVVAFILLVVDSLFSGFRATRRDIVIRAASIISCVAVMICLLCPVMVSGIHGTFSGRTTTTTAEIAVDASFFNSFYLSNADKDALSEIYDLNEGKKRALINESIDAVKGYSVREIRHGDANADNYALLMNYASIYGLYEFEIFSQMSTLCLIGFVAAALTVWQTLGYFVFLRERRRTSTIMRIISAICCIAALTMTIVFTSFIASYAEYFRIFNYTLLIGAGPIIAAIFSLLGIFTSDKIIEKFKLKGGFNARHLYSLFDEAKYDVVK